MARPQIKPEKKRPYNQRDKLEKVRLTVTIPIMANEAIDEIINEFEPGSDASFVVTKCLLIQIAAYRYKRDADAVEEQQRKLRRKQLEEQGAHAAQESSGSSAAGVVR